MIRPDCPVIHTDGRAVVLDLGAGSMDLGEPLAGIGVRRFAALIDRRLAQAGTGFGYGRWGERRDFYAGAHFDGEGSGRRDVHLGVDLFCCAGTPVRAPLAGRVHALANNARALDYGPVVILEHPQDNDPVYTLYGHLGAECLDALEPGMTIGAGEEFGTVGAPPGNGNWPPHLHFQLITDLEDFGTDYPGVAAAADARRWLARSPLPAEFFPDVSAADLDGREDREPGDDA